MAFKKSWARFPPVDQKGPLAVARQMVASVLAIMSSSQESAGRGWRPPMPSATVQCTPRATREIMIPAGSVPLWSGPGELPGPQACPPAIRRPVVQGCGPASRAWSSPCRQRVFICSTKRNPPWSHPLCSGCRQRSGPAWAVTCVRCCPCAGCPGISRCFRTWT